MAELWFFGQDSGFRPKLAEIWNLKQSFYAESHSSHLTETKIFGHFSRNGVKLMTVVEGTNRYTKLCQIHYLSDVRCKTFPTILADPIGLIRLAKNIRHWPNKNKSLIIWVRRCREMGMLKLIEAIIQNGRVKEEKCDWGRWIG